MKQVAAAVLAFSMAACGGTPAPAPPSPATSTTGVDDNIERPADSTSAAQEAIRAAVESTERRADDRARDADRKPGEVLAFFGVEPGMAVADLMSGTGYYADLLSRTVGDSGKVYAQNNKYVLGRIEDKLRKRISDTKLTNVTEWNRELEDLGFKPASLDGAIMVLFYHDTIWQKTDRAKMNASVFASLKPGGFFGVVDHVAADGAGDVSKTLHRIDPQMIKSEIEAAGFVLEAESDVLRHPEDARTNNVFDPAIRGKTDRVVYKFRKPAS